MHFFFRFSFFVFMPSQFRAKKVCTATENSIKQRELHLLRWLNCIFLYLHVLDHTFIMFYWDLLQKIWWATSSMIELNISLSSCCRSYFHYVFLGFIAKDLVGIFFNDGTKYFFIFMFSIMLSLCFNGIYCKRLHLLQLLD